MGIESIVGNNKKVIDEGLQGYWGTKSSSVNFCEPDYIHFNVIAEVHNTWTSLFLVGLPIVGLLKSNPTKEMAFNIAYVQLIIVGIGSMVLHSSLTSFGQACDELPMLWMCSSVANLFTLDKEKDAGINKSLKGSFIIIIFCIVQSIIYIRIQEWFHVFVVGYLSMVAMIFKFSYDLSLGVEEKKKHKHTPLLQWLWRRSIFCYVALGSSVWLVDMHFCDELSHLINFFGGVTPHVIWHFGAAYATYFMILLLEVHRCHTLGEDPELKWAGLIAPYITIKEKKRKK